jgi:O-antigen/teichoic acid export membrane protein
MNPANLAQEERLSFLVKDSVVYGGAMAISRVFSLITFPLVARHLSVAEYGMLDLFLVLATFLVTTLIFGQDSAVGRFFYENEDPENRREVISQSLLIQVAVCVAAVSILFLLSSRVAALVSTAEGSTHCFNIVLAQAPFTLAVNFAQNLLKWTFSRRAFLIMSIGYSAVQATCLSAAVLFFRVDTETVLIVNLITNALFGVLGLFMVRAWMVLPKRLDLVGDLLRFAFPIGIVCILGAAVPMLERQLVEKLLGVERLGFYAAGTKLAMLLTLVVGSFQTAWAPFSTAIHREADAAQTYNLVLEFFSLLVCVLTLTLDSVATPLMTLLASHRYDEATVVVFPLAMATAVQSISWVTEIGISLSKRTSGIVYTQVAYIAVIASTTLLLVPSLGLVGAALAMMLAQGVRSITASWLGQRFYPLPWNYGWVLNLVSSTIATGLLANCVLVRWIGSWSVAPFYLLVIALMCTYFWRRCLSLSAKMRLTGILLRGRGQ